MVTCDCRTAAICTVDLRNGGEFADVSTALMCRLFGLHAGTSPVSATFWLLDAPDSLAAQSHRNPDGAGIGVFDAGGSPVVQKQPIAAWDDVAFATAARDLTATTFVAHVRHASTGARTLANTHPFSGRNSLFAHNGVVLGLDRLDARLARLGASDLVHGETDSERLFALITAETARQDGDVAAGITAAIGWVGEHLPVYSVNFVMVSATDLWALRYPAANELWLLERTSATPRNLSTLDLRTDRIHARSKDLAQRPTVVVASEPMDGDPGWHLVDPGVLLHVGPDLRVQSSAPFPARPAQQLNEDQLAPAVALSQHSVP